MLFFKSITLVVLELGMNGHFSARTCGIHRTGVITWLRRANTVQISVAYAWATDYARQHGMVPPSRWQREGVWLVFFVKPPRVFFSHKKPYWRWKGGISIFLRLYCQWAPGVNTKINKKKEAWCLERVNLGYFTVGPGRYTIHLLTTSHG